MRHCSLTAVALDKRGRVLSVGRNSYLKTHPVQAKYAKAAGQGDRIYLHAEMAALIRAKAKVHSLVVTRHYSNGSGACSEPCAICMKAIKDYGVRKLSYFDLNGVEVEEHV